MSYQINKGPKDFAIRLGCEQGLYDFLTDYAKGLGMSRSGAVRRLVLIGARCEKEHGKGRMPASFEAIAPKQDEGGDDEFDWGED